MGESDSGIRVNGDVVAQLTSDPVLWMESLLSIEDRNGKILDFKLTPFQKKYVAWRLDSSKRKKKRRALLKTRQLYATTIILAFNLWKCVTTPGCKVLVMTNKDDTTAFCRLRIKQWCDQLEGVGMLPHREQDNDTMLTFDTLQSLMVFQTAGAKGTIRGGNFNILHFSEVAFWPGDPAKTIGGILPAISDESEVDLESTPQGAEGPLYDYYTQAKAGDLDDWESMFVPWYEHDEYVREYSEDFERTLTDKERKLRMKYGLSLGQLAWRRNQIAVYKNTGLGDEGMFGQEYPEDDISCFLAGTDTVLDSEALQDFIGWVTPPLVVYEEWDIWKEPVATNPYVIGVDSSEGKSDYSAAHIMNAINNEVVAVAHQRCTPSHLAKVIDAGARIYGNAEVVVETPGPGTTVLDRLLFQFSYNNLYYHLDDLTGKVKDDPGWPQNVKTRSNVIDTLQESTRHRTYRVYHEKTVRELASLTWRRVGNMKRARAEAAPGAHDDLVFSLGLALCTASDAGIRWRKQRRISGSNGVVSMNYGDPSAGGSREQQQRMEQQAVQAISMRYV